MTDQHSETKQPPAIRFLKFTNDEEEAEKEAKLKEAAARIEKAIAKDKAIAELVDYKPPDNDNQSTIDQSNDTRSLYERLEERRIKKKEALEESHKLSNLITKLDEDDVDYLQEVAKSKQEQEIRRRLEVHDALEAKKRLAEQKLLEEERLRRESLIGSTSGIASTSSKKMSSAKQQIKSKLNSLIKIKPRKVKDTDEGTEQGSNEEPKPGCAGQQKSGSTDDKNISGIRATEAQTSEETKQSDGMKRSGTGRDSDSSDQEPEKKRNQIHDIRDPICTCPKNVTRQLGILPSLPIQFRDPHILDSDDTNSDSEQDELAKRLMPRIRSCSKRRNASGNH